MNHGSLFSGMGGFDLAAEWMGWNNIFHCEWNEFGQRVLKHYWPNAISYYDITKTDFTIHRGRIDILTGGFPCQPYSTAGKRLGKEDERHLWPEMLRAIREIAPRFVVGENVRGLINWNGGMVFDEVQADMEVEGYEVLPFLLPACGVNAPHRRDRIWFIAHRKDVRCAKAEETECRRQECFFKRCDVRQASNEYGRCGVVAYSNSKHSEAWTQRQVLEQQNRYKTDGFSDVERRNKWQNFPTQSPVCNGNDGLPSRLDGITFSKWRNESIKAGGNAVVPQVVYQIFKAIEQLS